MKFSRHPDVRAERLDQLANVLGALYTPVDQDLPLIIADKLEQLERMEPRARRPVANDA